VNSFTAWLNALANERRVDPNASRAADGSYVPDPTQLSGFLYERFRAEFKTDQPVGLFYAGSQHQNGYIRVAPHRTTHIQTIHAGKVQVQDDKVWPALAKHCQRRGTITGSHHLKTCLFEVRA
jgi:tRNA nucleotidyltransferase (CCA-adding enzyme)